MTAGDAGMTEGESGMTGLVVILGLDPRIQSMGCINGARL